MDLVNEQIGKEGNVEIEISDGKVKLIVSYKGNGGGADLVAYVEAGYFLDKLAAAIPGKVDDAVIAALKLALVK